MGFLDIMKVVSHNESFFHFLPRRINNISNIKIKFILFNYIIQNELIFDQETVIDDFYKAQKLYHTMTKYIRLKKSKPSVALLDMGMNDLSDYAPNLRIELLHQGQMHSFYLRDLHTIWKRALMYSDELIAEPFIPKNPYNNIPFTEANLYNIYFKMLFNGLTIDSLIHRHVKAELDIKLFASMNEADLVENAAMSFIKHDINVLENYDYIRDIKIMFPNITYNIFYNSNVPDSVKAGYIKKMSKALSFFSLKMLSFQIPILQRREALYTIKLYNELKRLNKHIIGRPFLKRELVNGQKKTIRYFYFEEENVLY